MTPLQQLAQELKEAAQKYTNATGKMFEAEFWFSDFSTLSNPSKQYVFESVTVTATEETQA